MTPHHHDTIPAMQAAFQIGRAEYLAKSANLRHKVLFGWPSQKKVSVQNNLHLNGGGLDGVIRDAVDLAMVKGGNKSEAAKILKRNRSFVSEHLKRRESRPKHVNKISRIVLADDSVGEHATPSGTPTEATLPERALPTSSAAAPLMQGRTETPLERGGDRNPVGVLISAPLDISGEDYAVSRRAIEYTAGLGKYFKHVAVLLCALCVSVANSAQVVPGVQMAASVQSSVFSLAPVVAPKPMLLTWDNLDYGASNRVYVGSSRGNYTNSFVVATNSVPLTAGLSYKITSLVAGVESDAALWPSNRIGELWLRGMGTNATQGTNITLLLKFTNSPPGNMQFWGVANITTGWE